MATTTICAVADVHLGNHKRHGGPVVASLNKRCRETLDVMWAALDHATEAKADAFVVLGDMLDTTNPPPQLIAELERMFSAVDFNVILLLGNHEQVSDMQGDHALAPLAYTDGGHVRVIETPTIVPVGNAELWCVPFKPGAAKDWLPGVVKAMSVESGTAGRSGAKRSPHRLLALHLGIRDGDTKFYLRDAHDAIDAEHLVDMLEPTTVSHVLAGNWHDRKRWRFAWPQEGKANRTLDITQLGALVPTGWDNPGLKGYGTVATWKPDKVTLTELPGPRFVKLTGDSLVKLPKASSLYLSLEASEGAAADLREQLADKQEKGKLTAFEVTVSNEGAKEAAREAGNAARSAETLDEAVAGFVERMPLDAELDRAEVLAKSKEYLNRA
jgi:hypothetical protein